MEELLNLLNVFVSLKYFIVKHAYDQNVGYSFTLTPHGSVYFENVFITRLADCFPQHIYMEISTSNMSIEFNAKQGDQTQLIDSFCEVLRLSLELDDSTFIAFLDAHIDKKPFPRLHAKYERALIEKLEKIANTKISPFAYSSELAPEIITPGEIDEDEPAKPVEPEAATEKAAIPIPAAKSYTPTLWSTSSSVASETTASKEAELHWKLQSDLSNIVRLMDQSTQPTKLKHSFDLLGGFRNVAQHAKNTIINPLIGNAEAAINIKDKLRTHSKKMGRQYNQQEIADIIQHVTSRLLHIQQDHLKDGHAEEITFLISAETRARTIRSHLEQRSLIPQPEADEPSTPTSLGYSS